MILAVRYCRMVWYRMTPASRSTVFAAISRSRVGFRSHSSAFCASTAKKACLQEEYVAIRNERFVVPVIAGQRRKVDGVIHGASGSGQTLFIEPLETIDLNNDLVRLREEEAREVHRILRELTARLREHYSRDSRHADRIQSLDLLFAKASFASEFDCVVPTFTSDDATLHPLKSADIPCLSDILRGAVKACRSGVAGTG